MGAGPRRSRLSAAAARGLTRFVGRDMELEQLREALGARGAGHGQVVADRGRARRREVTARLGGHPLPPDPRLADPRGRLRLVREGHAVPPGDRASSGATSRSATGRAPEPSGRRSRASSSRSTARSSRPCRRSSHSSTCRWRIAGGRRWTRPSGGSGPSMRCKRLLLRESQVQPLLVVFEDLHWIDAETQALLDGLVESLPTARLLLLVNYRPEYQHGWGGKTYYPQLRLDPLAAGERDRAAGDPARERRRPRAPQAAPDRADRGQPLLPGGERADPGGDGALVGERGAYRLVKPPETVQVPATVQAILAARIDRLPPEDKALLQTAAVDRHRTCRWPSCGPSPDGRRTRCAGASPGSRRPSSCTRRACSRSSSTRSSMRSRTRWPTGACSRTAGARSTPGSSRPSSASMPSGWPSTSSAWPTTRSGAKSGTRPSRYLRQAGEKAMARSAYREAAAGLEQALDALRHLPESRDTDGAGHRPPSRRQRRRVGDGRVGERPHACP